MNVGIPIEDDSKDVVGKLDAADSSFCAREGERELEFAVCEGTDDIPEEDKTELGAFPSARELFCNGW